jgi:flagellar FliL protein
VAEEDKKDASAPEKDLEKDAGESSAEGSGEEGGLNPPKRQFSKKQKIIAAAIAGVLLLGGVGAGLYFVGVFGGEASHEATAEGKKDAHSEAPAEEGVDEDGDKEAHAPVFYALGDILVNLAGDGKRPNYLKLTISLELADEKDKTMLDALKPRIIDQFQLYLRELRVEDLRGSAGLFRLREELLLRVSEVVQPIRVRDVLFQEMLVQ